MAKIKHHPQGVYFEVHDASRAAGERTLKTVRNKLKKKAVHPYATGHLASTYRLGIKEQTAEGVTLRIYSDEVYARAIEKGAWIRGGPGPHISGSSPGRYEVQATVERMWGRNLVRELRSRT